MGLGADLQVLTIFIHELGHLIVGKCTRAQFVEWHIDPDLGGSTLLNGGDPYYYLPAGPLFPARLPLVCRSPYRINLCVAVPDLSPME